MKKLLLHIPHASLHIPFRDGYINDPVKIENEQLKLTDWYTDELFFSSTDVMITAPFSRVFCDVERFENDAEEIVDGLIDLCVVAIGTLDALGVNSYDAWNRVLAANMAKQVGVKPSRPNPLGLPDLIKPEGWEAPSHAGNHGLLTRLK